MFLALLNLVQKRLFFFILVAVAAGLGFGYFTGGIAFSPVLCLFAALIMIYPSLVPLPFHRLRVGFSAYREIGISLFVNFVVSPGLALLFGAVFLTEYPEFRIGLLLLSLLPGGGMATTWTLRSRADMPTSVGIILVNLFASVFAVSLLLPVSMDRLAPPTLSVSDGTVCVFGETTGGALSCGLGGADGLGMFSLALPMVVIAIVPLILAYVTCTLIVRRKGTEYLESVKGRFGSAGNLGLVVVLFLLMALGSNQALVEHPELLLRVAFPVVLFYAGLLAVSLLVAGRTRRTPRGKALVWGSFLRYITLALGLAVSLVYQNPVYALAILPVAFAYFIQIPASFWLERYLSPKA